MIARFNENTRLTSPANVQRSGTLARSPVMQNAAGRASPPVLIAGTGAASGSPYSSLEGAGKLLSSTFSPRVPSESKIPNRAFMQDFEQNPFEKR